MITVPVDHTYLEKDFFVGSDLVEKHRGILDYRLEGHVQEDVQWRMTGDLGAEDKLDLAKGPLNEDGILAERQGYHLPGAWVGEWEVGSPLKGVEGVGVGLCHTSFELDLPWGWDVPLSFVFENSTSAGGSKNGPGRFSCQLSVT